MALLNYSTTVDAYKTVAEIEQMLVKHGAKSIMKSYEGEDVTSLSFLIDTGNGNIPVKLPVRLDDVLQVLTEQKKAHPKANIKATREQANRGCVANIEGLDRGADGTFRYADGKIRGNLSFIHRDCRW